MKCRYCEAQFDEGHVKQSSTILAEIAKTVGSLLYVVGIIVGLYGFFFFVRTSESVTMFLGVIIIIFGIGAVLIHIVGSQTAPVCPVCHRRVSPRV